jgi:glycosyltransferase involved in cell wall biosynthesis
LKEPNSIRKEIFGDKINDLFIIGMVAAFEVRKDYKTLIDAAIALISSQDKLRFILVGGGAGLNEIKSAVPSSLLNKIVFLGQRSNVESFINIFDVGVLLTNAKVHGEGISNSILEYMALGKPVIASRGGGTNEVIIENETGLLIDPNKKEQLIEKIDLLMKNKNRESIGQRGKNLVWEKFNLKTMVNNYTHVYRTLLTQKKSYHLIF